MRIVVMSDSHKRFDTVRQVVMRHLEADLFLHLGDGTDEFEEMTFLYPKLRFLCVRGNCDHSIEQKTADVITCGIAKILFTHGHLYSVKSTLAELKAAARVCKANVVLYGHTHIAHVEYDNGLYIMNPGSVGGVAAGCPTYGIVDVTDTSVVCYTVPLPAY